MVAYVDTLDHSSSAGRPVPARLSKSKKALNSQCWPVGTALNALQVLVQIGHGRMSPGLNLGAAFLLAEMIPLAPPVATRTPPVALTGFISGLALSDLFAIPGNVLGGQARWEIPQALGEFSTQLLVLLAASGSALGRACRRSAGTS